ncbi:MAG: response regulator [Deltaproteobacteria bacterium]|nr:response regulator [Deltaproteobacteria bacterium]
MGTALRLLLVEDNDALAQNLSEILEAEQFSVHRVATAEAGLAAAETAEFAGVVTDVRLPGASGLDLLAGLRARGSALPCVVLSAFADEGTVARAEALGAIDVLAKPVNLPRLFQVVQGFGARAGGEPGDAARSEPCPPRRR